MIENKTPVDCLIELRTKSEKQLFFFRNCLKETPQQNEPRFKMIISNFEQLLENIDNILKSECRHIYEEDYIDITPDRSQKITYCKICHCTF